MAVDQKVGKWMRKHGPAHDYAPKRQQGQSRGNHDEAVDAYVDSLETRVAKLEEERRMYEREHLQSELRAAYEDRDAAIRETANLRDGITMAIGMPWITTPGSTCTVCPDDVAIIAAVAELAKK